MNNIDMVVALFVKTKLSLDLRLDSYRNAGGWILRAVAEGHLRG
jgi:hypothetical protein